jgi:ribosomal protein S18 acetylase RimI-like enzyme
MDENLDFYKATRDDFESIFQIIELTGWGETREDIERVMKNPNSTYITVVDRITGEMVGITLAVAYNKFGFIGHVIVKPEFRGMGIGYELMIEAIDHLKFQGCQTIKLDAVAKAKTLYERSGFTFELNSLRYQYEIIDDSSFDLLIKNINANFEKHSISRIKKDEIQVIAKKDSEIFGVNRENEIELFFDDYPELAFVIRNNDNSIAGYTISQFEYGILKLRFGYSESVYVMTQILKTLVDNCKKKSDFKAIKLGILENNLESIAILEKIGFKKTSFSLRMYWGKKSDISLHPSIFAIGDPAKG